MHTHEATFGTLIAIYLGSLVLKWAYEVLGDLNAHRETGLKAWWALNRFAYGQKAVIQVPLSVAWCSGLALGVVNSVSQGMGFGAMETVGLFNTVIAAWMLDSFGKPLARKLKAKESEG